MFKHIGKSVVVDYETGYLFHIDYLSKNKLKWTLLKERTDGSPMSGEEEFFFKELDKDIF